MSRSTSLKTLRSILFRTEQCEKGKPGESRFSWEESLEHIRCGWEEGVRNIAVKTDMIHGSAEGTTIGITRQITGDFFDVGLVLAGEPECWYQVDEIAVPDKTVTVIVDCMTPWTTHQESIYNFGAVAGEVIDRLRRKCFVNIVCSIYGLNTRARKRKWKGLDLRIEMSTNNRYSRSVLAFFTAHPGFLRRAFFAAFEKENGYYEDDYGYGHCMDARSDGYENPLVLSLQRHTNEYSSIERAIAICEKTMQAYESKIK